MILSFGTWDTHRALGLWIPCCGTSNTQGLVLGIPYFGTLNLQGLGLGISGIRTLDAKYFGT